MKLQYSDLVEKLDETLDDLHRFSYLRGTVEAIYFLWILQNRTTFQEAWIHYAFLFFWMFLCSDIRRRWFDGNSILRESVLDEDV